jgi:hypothetical protein
MSDAATPPSSALPDRIAKRITQMRAEVGAIVATANAYRTTVLPDRISFEIRSSVLGRDILSDYERAQSVSFITRYEHFPLDVKARLVTDTLGNWYIGNLWDLRQALNDSRINRTRCFTRRCTIPGPRCSGSRTRPRAPQCACTTASVTMSPI